MANFRIWKQFSQLKNREDGQQSEKKNTSDGTLPNSNKKNIEKDKFDTPYTQIHDSPLSGLVQALQLKGGGIKLVYGHKPLLLVCIDSPEECFDLNPLFLSFSCKVICRTHRVTTILLLAVMMGWFGSI